MAKGMRAGTYRTMERQDRLVDLVIAEVLAEQGKTPSDELPPEPTQAELLAKAGARTVKVGGC
jgi:hypothetical protein